MLKSIFEELLENIEYSLNKNEKELFLSRLALVVTDDQLERLSVPKHKNGNIILEDNEIIITIKELQENGFSSFKKM